jgi:SAM-dependent methyltransferase
MITEETVYTAAGYNCLAPFYDRFTEGWEYERWISAIEERAISLGLRGTRALDLACGTGKSTAPLLDRGYSVVACDISQGMIDQARRNHPADAHAFVVADMRELPVLGEFDLVLCLDDAVNHLLSDRELESTFAGVARQLAPGGMFAFDVNTLHTYRTGFAAPLITEGEGIIFVWRGEGATGLEPGERSSASVDVFAKRLDGLWERSSIRHVQRHHPSDALVNALERSGLRHQLTLGQLMGARLEDGPTEERHSKLMYFASQRPRR